MKQMPTRWSLKNGVCQAYKSCGAGSSALHGHRHFLLTLITDGSGIQTLNGRDIAFRQGDLFLLSPADFHRNTVPPGKSFDYYGVKFPYELLDDRLSALLRMDRLPLSVRLHEASFHRARVLFAQLVEESTAAHMPEKATARENAAQGRESLGNAAYMRALIELLVILVLREDTGAVSHPTEPVNRALGYLYTHFHEPICVAEVAAFVGYTPNYFSTCFRKQLGITFGEYLRELRLSYAENLLRASKLPITEVCYECGFGSPAHFTRCFRERFHVSPQEYRRQISPTP